MIKLLKSPILNVVTVAAILLAAAVALYALFLLLVGVPTTVVREGETIGRTGYVPHPAAIVPLLAAVALLVGLSTRKLLIAWMGFALLAAFSVSFLFSIGGGLLLLAGLLLVLLTIVSIHQRDAG
jgi:hypothetical protein